MVIVGLGTLGLFIACDLIMGGEGEGGLLAGVNPHLRSLIIAVVGAAWIWFAGIIIAQCAGMTDWSPVSGMALLTVVLVMTLAGRRWWGRCCWGRPCALPSPAPRT
jgi:hypothetical protein